MSRRQASKNRNVNYGAKSNGFIRAANCEVNYEFVPFRYPTNLLYVMEEQQFYKRIKREKPNVYTCYEDECHCKVYVRDGKCFVAETGSHNHSNQAQMYINLCAKNEMKKIIGSVNNHLKPKQVYKEVMKRYIFFIFYFLLTVVFLF